MIQSIRQNRWRWVLALALVLALLPTTIWAVDAASDYAVRRWTIDGGGATSSGGAYAVAGTIGQHDAKIAASTGGAYSLNGGFWHAEVPVEVGEFIYLPLVARPNP